MLFQSLYFNSIVVYFNVNIIFCMYMLYVYLIYFKCAQLYSIFK